MLPLTVAEKRFSSRERANDYVGSQTQRCGANDYVQAGSNPCCEQTECADERKLSIHPLKWPSLRPTDRACREQAPEIKMLYCCLNQRLKTVLSPEGSVYLCNCSCFFIEKKSIFLSVSLYI